MGKSVISANLGLALGEKDNQVLLVDADLPSGNLAHYLGMEKPRTNLLDFLSGEVESIEEVLKNVNEKVDVLPTTNSLRKFLLADISRIEDFLPDLVQIYDYVIVDSPPGISKNSISPMEISDQLLLIVTPDEASVTAAENIQKVGNVLELGVRGFIINKREERGFFGRLFGEDSQMSVDEIEGRIPIENLGTVPYDDSVRKSTDLGKPLLNHDEGSEASEAIKEISERI